MIGTVDHVIDAIGGTAAAADFLGTSRSTVSSWRARGSIPAEHWAAIVGRADEIGRPDVSFEALALMHAKQDTTDVLEARP